MPATRPAIVWDLFVKAAAANPEKIAVVDGDRGMTYRELAAEAQKIGSWLIYHDLAPEDRVAILAERSLELVISIAAAAFAGAAFVILNPRLKPTQLQFVIDDSQSDFAIFTPRQSLLLERTLAISCRPPSQLLLLDQRRKEEVANAPTTRPAAHTIRWSEIRDSVPQSKPPREPLADDIAALIYTSGSTGKPKGVVISGRNLVEGGQIVSSYLGIEESDRIIALLPFCFDYGLNQLFCSLYRQATAVLYEFLLPRDLISFLRREEITVLAGMRPIWLSLLRKRLSPPQDNQSPAEVQHAAPKVFDLPKLRILTHTGGKMPETTLRQMRRAFPGAEIFLMYGLTEAFRSTFLPPGELSLRPRSIGKAIPGVEIRIVDEAGEDVPPGVEGELIHRGALVARGYWNAPEETARVFRPNPRFSSMPHLSERVVFSGDRAFRDEDGFIYFVGRRDGMIKHRGYRISPHEVEEAILACCKHATEAVAFGIEHDDERDTSLICVLEGDPRAINDSDLLRQIRRSVAGHIQPTHLLVDKNLPRTASGKIDRIKIITRWKRQADAANGHLGPGSRNPD